MRREPERSCVGCRQRGEKASFVRVVRRPDGSVVVDPAGKAAGRGAYVHRQRRCVDVAVGRGGFARVLRVPLAADDLATLRSEIEKELE